MVELTPDELLNKALKTVCPTVRRLIYDGDAKTFITFETIISLPDAPGDDDFACMAHTFRVHLFAQEGHSKLTRKALAALKKHGFTINSVDGEIYETDTGFYHVPITISMEEWENGDSRT